MSLENLGVTNIDLLNEIQGQVDVVVSSAAVTKFDERYDIAFRINTLGAKHVSSFVNESRNIKLLLHVSTAYVSSENSGIILESQFKMGETLNGKNDLNIEEEKTMILERHRQLVIEKSNEKAFSSAMKNFGQQRAKLHGWPNTYVFTKAMGEMLLHEGLRQDVPLVILRPTIVTSTYKEPFPGWIEGVKTIDGVVAAYSRGKTSILLGNPSTVLDLIPADMVVNAMLVMMVVHINNPCLRTIYHVGSSMSNPLKISSFLNYMCDYFAKHPLINGQGNPFRSSHRVLPLSSMSSFKRYMAIRYTIPLKVVEYANTILPGAFNAWYFSAKQQMKFILRYDDANLNKLHIIVERSFKDEMEMFFINTKSIDWESYFMNVHFPGLVKHAFKKSGVARPYWRPKSKI